MPEQSEKTAPPSAPAAKKAYVTPKLTECGHVAKLTMAKGTTSSEGGTPNKMSCL